MKPNPALTFSLHRRESVRDGIRRLADSLAADATAQAGRPTAESRESIHRARLILKRFRALLRLLRPIVPDETASGEIRRLRRAARRLSPARDAAVGLALLDDLARRGSPPQDVVQRVRDRFAEVVHDPVAQPDRVKRALAAAAGAARSTARALDRTPWKCSGWKALEGGLRRSYRRARRRYERSRESLKAADFHAWRTSVKALLHQLQLIQPSATRNDRTRLRDLDQLQNLLGESQDLTILEARLADPSADLGEPAAIQRTRKQLLVRQHALHRQALKLGRRLLRARPSEFVAGLHRSWKQWRDRA